MKAIEKKLLEILQPSGLAILLRATLGRPEMVRIANSSRVSVPGMRNRVVSIERLSETLADKFVSDGPARRSIMKALVNASRGSLATYRKLPTEEIHSKLADDERARADADLPALLFHLIAEPRGEIGEEAIRGAVFGIVPKSTPRETGTATQPATDDELLVLRSEKSELSRRTADLVALVDRLRERDRRFREEAAQRKFDVNNLKLQFNKSKKERDALEKELRALTTRLDQIDKKPFSAADLGERIVQIMNETRRLASALDKLNTRLRGGSVEDRTGAASPALLARALEDLKRDMHAVRKDLEERSARALQLAEETAARISAINPGLPEKAKDVHESAQRGGQERVGVFVDVQNMFYGARGQNARLDFEVLLQTTTRGRRLICALAYVVEAREIDQSGFIALLQQKRYEVKRKDLKVRSDGSFKGDWDMEIALDALDLASSLDVVVLVTGDGDFTSLVQKLKRIGPRVEVYAFPRNTAKELREAADKFVPIDKRMLIKMPHATDPGRQPTGTAGS